MITDFFKQLAKLPQLLTTYNVGLLQTKAYRILKSRTTELLKPYKLSTVDWALIGVLYENKDGLRASELAEILGVDASFITQTFTLLHKKGWIDYALGKTDKRVKNIKITPYGRQQVPKIEKMLREDMRSSMKDISIKDIMGYLKVLDSITNSVPKKSQKNS